MPFSFHISLPADAASPGAPTRIVISKSIEADVLSHPTRAFTEEDVFVVHCSPQSVFRVRPATRCSSTLSGGCHLDFENLHCALICRFFFRTHCSNSMCLIFADWEYDGDRIGRYKCSFMGFVHRDAFTRAFWPQGLGTLRRVGSNGEKASHGWSRWSCVFNGPGFIPT